MWLKSFSHFVKFYTRKIWIRLEILKFNTRKTQKLWVPWKFVPAKINTFEAHVTINQFKVYYHFFGAFLARTNSTFRKFKFRKISLYLLEDLYSRTKFSKWISSLHMSKYPANIYMFQVNNRSTRKKCEICSKLTIKAPERRQWRRSSVFIVNFGHISHLFLVSLLLTWNR